MMSSAPLSERAALQRFTPRQVYIVELHRALAAARASNHVANRIFRAQNERKRLADHLPLLELPAFNRTLESRRPPSILPRGRAMAKPQDPSAEPASTSPCSRPILLRGCNNARKRSPPCSIAIQELRYPLGWFLSIFRAVQHSTPTRRPMHALSVRVLPEFPSPMRWFERA